ncbi:DedA family protein [Luteococcus peritonei]|uniref:DedA family protein n=1 Tax=Luteococcus peritonei TaxID=88874 RepID=A0ABW4RYU8_9ACTN
MLVDAHTAVSLPTLLSTDVVGTVMDWLMRLMTAIGAPGAALAVALENIFPPIPSEVILPLAGFAAAEGHFSLAAAIAWTTLGSVVGAWLLYWLGQVLGEARLRHIVDKLPLTRQSDIDTAMAWFDRHGDKAVFFGRMVPGVRSLISVPAGLHGMRAVPFTLCTTLGSLLWNSLLIFAGYELGANWTVVEGWVGQVQNVVVALVLAAAAWFVVSRLRQRSGGPASGEDASQEDASQDDVTRAADEQLDEREPVRVG